MGILEHLRGDGADEPAALLHHHPSVLLPASAEAAAVAATVARWSPLGTPTTTGAEVAEGIRWYGPIVLTDDLVDEASIQRGFATAYVAACERTRILRSPTARRWRRWTQRFTDSRLGLLTHSTAGFIDPGFSGHVTLELANVANLPIKLWPGMKIG